MKYHSSADLIKKGRFMIQGASTKSLVDIDKDGYDVQFLGNRSTWLYKALNMWFNQSEYLLN
jgi:hypothetical protein